MINQEAKPQAKGRKKRKYGPETREKVLELYWDGLGRKRIARYLNIPRGTVCTWIHLYGMEKERTMTNTINITIPEAPDTLNRQMFKAKTAEEWLDAFHKLTETKKTSIEATSVYLVCTPIHSRSGINKLVTIIRDVLKRNPMSGETFAFCTKERQTIITITWKGNMFNIRSCIQL